MSEQGRIAKLINRKLNELFSEYIDINDIKNQSQENIKEKLSTRTLAAFPIFVLGNNISAHKAGTSVTDGYHDFGMDAILADTQEKILYIVQAKWQTKGHGSISEDAALKLKRALDLLIDGDYEDMNEKIKRKREDISKVLDDLKAKIKIIVIYSGTENLSKTVNKIFNEITEKLNENGEYSIASLEVFNQKRIYDILASGEKGEPLGMELGISNWGSASDPYFAIYGSLSAETIAKWSSVVPRLFSQNIRYIISNSEVNDGMIDTLLNDPEKFWYFNNGITALCSNHHKKISNDKRELAYFEFQGFQVVNGAQTVGSIIEAYHKDPGQVSKASVQIRVISLQGGGEELADKVTRYNNTQNKIDSRDFVSLDPEQDRIQIELKLYNVYYVYKSGETITDPKTSFSLDDATAALACKLPDIKYSVRVKDKISSFWKDIDEAPYKMIFNSSTDSLKVWKLVQIQRIVERWLSKKSKRKEEYQKREHLIAVHGNRIILHLVYQSLNSMLDDHDANEVEISRKLVKETLKNTKKYFENLVVSVDDLYQGSYPANVFRNIGKCKNIIKNINE